MQTSAVVALVALAATILIQLIVAVYVYGRLTERVSNHTEKLGKIDERLDDHERRLRIVELGDSLAQLAQWVKETHARTIGDS